MISYQVVPASQLSGEVKVPGDKSVTHRSLILSSLAQGNSLISGALEAEDCLHTLAIMQKLGVSIQKLKPTEYQVTGVGLSGLKSPASPDEVLDVGNSGTGIRLLTGLLAAQKFSTVISGDKSIQNRPMGRIIDPLSQMGAHIEAHDGKAPLKIFPSPDLKAIQYTMPVSSAQVKSALLLAGLYAKGETIITDPGLSRDHTENMLKMFGIPIQTQKNRVMLKGPVKSFQSINIQVPGDFSSAAFFIAAALIHPHAKVTIKNVGINPRRAALLDVLKQMGANIRVLAPANSHSLPVGSEPMADLVVSSSELTGIELSGEIISQVIDEIPIFCVIASQAKTVSVVKDASELKVKESNRIETTVSELSKLGVKIEATDDGMIIKPSVHIQGGQVTSHGDHRIAMSCAILGLMAQDEIQIDEIECVNTSFPSFWKLLEQICH